MATAGALVGASIAGLAYKLSGQNYILTFALATIPATLALVITCSARPGRAAFRPSSAAHCLCCSRSRSQPTHAHLSVRGACTV
jgi:hypothetical protein